MVIACAIVQWRRCAMTGRSVYSGNCASSGVSRRGTLPSSSAMPYSRLMMLFVTERSSWLRSAVNITRAGSGLRSAVGGPYDIIAVIVFLEHEAPAPRDDHAVNVPLPINDELIEPRRKVRHKASLIRRYRLPFEGCRGTRGDGRRAKRSSTEQKVAAIEHGR